MVDSRSPSAPTGPVPPETGAMRDPWFAAGLLWLLLVAGWMLFLRLGAPDLRGDEAIWGVTLDAMTPENAWMGLWRSGWPADRPPLFLWLAFAIRPLVDDPEIVIRFWSAAFGLATVPLTVLFGARLFGKPTGLLAGWLLLAQGDWIFHFSHGARSGVSDSLITFFLLATTAALLWRSDVTRPAWHSWLLAGISLAAIGMLKPLLLLPTFGLLVVVLLLFEPGPPGPRRLMGAARAGLICFALLLPWNLAMAWRFGVDFLHRNYLGHISKRVVEGIPDHAAGPLYYLGEISQWPGVFSLYLPAMALAGVLAFRGPNRRAWGLTVVFGLGWVAFFSLFVSKRIWYVYPVYPFVALALAAGLAFVGTRITSRFQRRPSPRATLAMGVLAIVLLGVLVVRPTDERVTGREFWFDLPWRLYRGIEASPHDDAEFVRFRFPKRRGPATYGFYDARMSEASVVRGSSRLREVLEEAAASGSELVVVSPVKSRPVDDETLRLLDTLGGRSRTKYGFRILTLGAGAGRLLRRGGVPDWRHVDRDSDSLHHRDRT